MRKAKVKKVDRFDIVSIHDWHCPFHDERALAVGFKFCEHNQPNIIIIHEAHDFYSLSRFDKDPARANRLQEEIDVVTGYFRELRRICPKSRIILLNSNHLDRLRKYLWSKAKALASLRVLQLPALLQLKELGIEYREDFIYRNFLFKHGDIVRKFSSYTAKNEFAKEGMSGASGHTHRIGKHFITLRGGKYVWVEGGCMCDLHPEYISGTADWQHGLSLVSFKGKSNHFLATDVPIIDYEILYGNVSIAA